MVGDLGLGHCRGRRGGRGALCPIPGRSPSFPNVTPVPVSIPQGAMARCCPKGPAGQQAQRRDKGAPVHGSRCICSCSGPWRAWDATPHPVVLRRVSASGPGLPSALQAGATRPLGLAGCQLGRVSAPSWFCLGPQGSAPLGSPSLAWSTCFRDFLGKAVRISCLPPSGRRRLSEAAPGPTRMARLLHLPAAMAAGEMSTPVALGSCGPRSFFHGDWCDPLGAPFSSLWRSRGTPGGVLTGPGLS